MLINPRFPALRHPQSLYERHHGEEEEVGIGLFITLCERSEQVLDSEDGELRRLALKGNNTLQMPMTPISNMDKHSHHHTVPRPPMINISGAIKSLIKHCFFQCRSFLFSVSEFEC